MSTAAAVAGQANVVTQPIGGQDRAFVLPPHISIGAGAAQVRSVQWTNGTSAKARFWFPNGDEVFVPPAGEDFSKPIEIAAGGRLTLQVKAAPNPGSYHYHIHCDAVKDCALGNSEPRVTVP